MNNIKENYLVEQEKILSLKRVKKLDLNSMKCFKFILDDLFKNDIKIEFRKIESDDIAGFFSPYEKKIVISSGRDFDWYSILIHEYCHFRQWVEKTHTFTNMYEHMRDYSPYDLMVRCINTANLELDCEKRVVSMIKKWKLPIDIKTYVKMANAYVFSHLYICLYGKKIDFNKLYCLLKIVPSSFRKVNHYKFIKKHEKIFEKMVIKKCIQYY